MDRRSRRYHFELPARGRAGQLDILVESVGHVNFGNEIHDRKGLFGPAHMIEHMIAFSVTNDLTGEWKTYPFPMDTQMLSVLKWKKNPATGPAFWRGQFVVTDKEDTFLDLQQWGKGLVWVNGHCLARYWNIGPTQTAYLPGPWLHEGTNEIIMLDLIGPQKPVIAGLNKPILDDLRPSLDFARNSIPKRKMILGETKPFHTGSFAAGTEAETIMFTSPVEGRQFCIECLNAHDGKPFAAIAELDLLDAKGKSISHLDWTIAFVDSEEMLSEDGSASNAINGQTSDFWHTAWSQEQPAYPHHLVIDLGNKVRIGGLRYTPRAGDKVAGRIKDYRIYVGDKLVGD
jgi:beta-galactosidase